MWCNGILRTTYKNSHIHPACSAVPSLLGPFLISRVSRLLLSWSSHFTMTCSIHKPWLLPFYSTDTISWSCCSCCCCSLHGEFLVITKDPHPGNYWGLAHLSGAHPWLYWHMCWIFHLVLTQILIFALNTSPSPVSLHVNVTLATLQKQTFLAHFRFFLNMSPLSFTMRSPVPLHCWYIWFPGSNQALASFLP